MQHASAARSCHSLTKQPQPPQNRMLPCTHLTASLSCSCSRLLALLAACFAAINCQLVHIAVQGEQLHELSTKLVDSITVLQPAQQLPVHL